MRWLRIALLGLFLLPLSASAMTNNFTITVTTTFTPLHTYFMAASGCSNANSGADAAHPWCNPDNNGHVGLVCGDVVIAAAGTYSGMDITHTPTGCGVSGDQTTGSSSGGIDGTGGIRFAIILCGGSDLEACKVNSGNGTGFRFLNVACCWSVQGFKIQGNPATAGQQGDGIQVRACLDNTPTQAHHFAFINNIVYSATSAYGTNDCGQNNGNFPGNGVDYWAVIGSIAQAANQHTVCLAAIDAPGPSQWNTDAGTHIFFYGNFSYAGLFVCDPQEIDVEGFMFDTWDAHGYTQTGVMLNNMAWYNQRNGFKSFFQHSTLAVSTQKFINNTGFANNAGCSWCTGGSGHIADLQIEANINTTTFPINYVIKDNIIRSNYRITPGGNGDVYAFMMAQPDASNYTGSLTITGNVFSAIQTVCDNSPNCDPGNNTLFSGNGIGNGWWAGTNFNDPSFTNTTDLLNNWVGTPDCTGYENVTQCMGYDAVTNTLRSNTPISDLTPTATGTSTKGYQKPTMTCVTSANFPDFPAWLKGVVYLHWTGSIVEQRAGLVNVPCGM
jgi:hypothetical protein